MTLDSDSNRVTPKELVDALSKHQGGKDIQDRSVNINVDLIETILLTDESDQKVQKPAKRKETGFVSQEQLRAVNRVSFKAASPEHEGPHDDRVKDRKGTGFVSKEQLLHMLDELSSDEEDEEGLGAGAPRAPAKAEEKATDGGKARCQARKGTGFVTKSKLKKVLTAVGEDEET